jgi:hypothetical protein
MGALNENREVFPENFPPLGFPRVLLGHAFKKSLKTLSAPEVADASHDPAP